MFLVGSVPSVVRRHTSVPNDYATYVSRGTAIFLEGLYAACLVSDGATIRSRLAYGVSLQSLGNASDAKVLRQLFNNAASHRVFRNLASRFQVSLLRLRLYFRRSVAYNFSSTNAVSRFRFVYQGNGSLSLFVRRDCLYRGVLRLTTVNAYVRRGHATRDSQSPTYGLGTYGHYVFYYYYRQ